MRQGSTPTTLCCCCVRVAVSSHARCYGCLGRQQTQQTDVRSVKLCEWVWLWRWCQRGRCWGSCGRSWTASHSHLMMFWWCSGQTEENFQWETDPPEHMTERHRKSFLSVTSDCTTPPSERLLDLFTPSFIHLYSVVLKQYLLFIYIYLTLIYLLLLFSCFLLFYFYVFKLQQ